VSKPALIDGMLVDVRNVPSHKCVRLSIEVPAERAREVLEAFGWPTGVDPIPVAVARLGAASSSGRTPEFDSGNAGSIPAAATKAKGTYAQQAGILCQQQAFRRFLGERYQYDVPSADHAAVAIREICGVDSRRELIPGTEEGERFRNLKAGFDIWMRDLA
jgi:hypothetical protein